MSSLLLPEPTRARAQPWRVAAGSALIVVFAALVVYAARATAAAPLGPVGTVVVLSGAPLATLAIGSLYEWLVHRFLYHRRWNLQFLADIFEVHHKGHHWHRFPPDEYVDEGPLDRIPVDPMEPYETCDDSGRRLRAWLGQFALYMAVGVPLAFAPAWLLTHNLPFTLSVVATGIVTCVLFIETHDAMHYPEDHPFVGQSWFRFLNRHHYIHHIDMKANLNFLLPLCDLLFGTLKTELEEDEKERWPDFETASRDLPDR